MSLLENGVRYNESVYPSYTMPGYLALSIDQLQRKYYETTLKRLSFDADYSDNVVIQDTVD